MRQRSRILVVDSDADHLELVARTLSNLGRVEIATSGEEGWALLPAHDPDVVIADQRLPDMPGVELLHRAGQRDVHVGRVLLTHYGDTWATIDAVDRDRVDAFLGKPSLPHQLLVTVRSVLERTRAARDNTKLVSHLTEKNRELRETLDKLRGVQRRVIDSERLCAIGRMSAMIVHDFRSPLAVIRSAAGALADGDLEEAERLEIAGEVREEVERMSRMCADLLDLSRASEGSIALANEHLDDLVEEALALIAEEAAHRGVRLETQLESGAVLRLDADRMRRALLNLGHNALEAMPEGGVLRVATAPSEGGFCITVVDTGAGVPAEIADTVFDPFVTAAKPGGSGLGLAVVKKVVEDHGGRVALEKSASGACFRVFLPSDLSV
jgi:signal transduction histidine kinase